MTQSASSLQSQATRRAASSGRPQRPIGNPVASCQMPRQRRFVASRRNPRLETGSTRSDRWSVPREHGVRSRTSWRTRRTGGGTSRAPGPGRGCRWAIRSGARAGTGDMPRAAFGSPMRSVRSASGRPVHRRTRPRWQVRGPDMLGDPRGAYRYGWPMPVVIRLGRLLCISEPQALEQASKHSKAGSNPRCVKRTSV